MILSCFRTFFNFDMSNPCKILNILKIDLRELKSQANNKISDFSRKIAMFYTHGTTVSDLINYRLKFSLLLWDQNRLSRSGSQGSRS